MVTVHPTTAQTSSVGLVLVLEGKVGYRSPQEELNSHGSYVAMDRKVHAVVLKYSLGSHYRRVPHTFTAWKFEVCDVGTSVWKKAEVSVRTVKPIMNQMCAPFLSRPQPILTSHIQKQHTSSLLITMTIITILILTTHVNQALKLSNTFIHMCTLKLKVYISKHGPLNIKLFIH